MFEAVLEKDVRIQELEEINEQYESQISNYENDNRKLVDISEYNQVLTLNSAMKSNIKSLTAQVADLDKVNKDLI